MKALQLNRANLGVPPTFAKAILPIPRPKPGYALVQIRYASIQPSDRMNAQGGFPYTTYPRVPGRDYSGVVIDVAGDTNDTKFWIGKSVYGTSGSTLGFGVDGTHAQYCLIPCAALVEKPALLSHIQAATVGVPFTTALLCLRRAQVTANDIVLVLGSNGAVGSAAVQIAKALGAKQVLTAARRDDSKPDILLATKDIAALLEDRVSALTNGNGVDVVVDTVGDPALMSATMEQLANNGRFAWIAAPRGNVDKSISLDIFQAYRKGLSLLGCNSISPSVEELAEQLRFMGDWIDRGWLKAQDEKDFDMVTLDNAIENGYEKTGKVIIDMS
ncbi:uncharacterized protein N7484_011304 [Penicillium longicatenatum]|uniref:uncharacterized protein n=1 Tax=Penicillium longicatenatum TaxID=1561947 RepID=UPI002548D837|nr:uncharacterized protein N7484_011304 [Penicillium longicatenatum]KAJ5631204.1 hypothetical protein N7484_011304 [Penicillium longicatenatum]